MNRKQRRAAIARAPRVFRKPLARGFVPILDITEAQLKEAGIDARQGALLRLPGKRWNIATSALESCAEGDETPFRVNITPGAVHGLDEATAS